MLVYCTWAQWQKLHLEKVQQNNWNKIFTFEFSFHFFVCFCFQLPAEKFSEWLEVEPRSLATWLRHFLQTNLTSFYSTKMHSGPPFTGTKQTLFSFVLIFLSIFLSMSFSVNSVNWHLHLFLPRNLLPKK